MMAQAVHAVPGFAVVKMMAVVLMPMKAVPGMQVAAVFAWIAAVVRMVAVYLTVEWQAWATQARGWRSSP